MPILYSGTSPQLNLSARIVLTGQQPCIGRASPSCNRLFVPAGFTRPDGNLVLDSGFDDPSFWGTTGGWVVTGGKTVGTAAAGYTYKPSGLISAGATYAYSFTVSGWSAGTVSAYVGSSPVFSAPAGADGTYTGTFTATTGLEYGVFSGDGFTGNVDELILVPQDIAGTSSITFAPAATLVGSGAVIGASALAFAPSATVTGKGVISGSSTLVFSPSAAATGKGPLTGASAIVFAPAGTMTGKGAIIGAGALAFAPSGTLAGKGAVAGSSALVFSLSAALSGKGALAGSSSLALNAAGTLTGNGALAGTSILAFAHTGTLGGSGSLNGMSTISFTLAGLLSNYAVIIPIWPPLLILTPDPVPMVV